MPNMKALALMVAHLHTGNTQKKVSNIASDDNFKLDKNCKLFSRHLENTVGKGEIVHYEQFLLFPHCFQKTCTGDT